MLSIQVDVKCLALIPIQMLPLPIVQCLHTIVSDADSTRSGLRFALSPCCSTSVIVVSTTQIFIDHQIQTPSFHHLRCFLLTPTPPPNSNNQRIAHTHPLILPPSHLKQLPGKYLTCPVLSVPSLLVETAGSSARKMIAASASNLRKPSLSLTFTNKPQNVMTCVCYSNPMVSWFGLK